MDIHEDILRTATTGRAPVPLGLDGTPALPPGGRAGARLDPRSAGVRGAGHADRQNRLSRFEAALEVLAESRRRFLAALPAKDSGGKPTERLRRLREQWYEHRGWLEMPLNLLADYLSEAHDPADRRATRRLEELLTLPALRLDERSGGRPGRTDARPLLAHRALGEHEDAVADEERRRTPEGLREVIVLGAEALFLVEPERGPEARRLGESLERRREETDGWMQLLLDNLPEFLDRSRTARFKRAEAREAGSPPPAESRPTRRLEKTWVEVQVVRAGSGAPFSGVRLVVTAPNGDQTAHTTNSSGVVRVDDIDPGTCEVTSDLKSARRETTLNYVRLGAVSNPAPAAGGAGGGAPATGTFVLARIENHKVKAGESIDSLARGAGMTWQDLSVFNWGTCVPNEINVHLVNDVGCTKKTLDGKNFMFDDSDNPGIMYIPHPLEQSGLATGERHVVQVGADSRFLIILENEAGLRIPEAAFEATFADGSVRSGTLDRNGVAVVENPPPGEVAVLYPDHDDIVAKSTAVTIRKAFADRDIPMVLWCLKQPPEIMKKAEAAYAKYVNDLSGQGLVEDVYQEVTEPPALQLAVGLMALAGLEVKEPVTVGEG